MRKCIIPPTSIPQGKSSNRDRDHDLERKIPADFIHEAFCNRSFASLCLLATPEWSEKGAFHFPTFSAIKNWSSLFLITVPSDKTRITFFFLTVSGVRVPAYSMLSHRWRSFPELFFPSTGNLFSGERWFQFFFDFFDRNFLLNSHHFSALTRVFEVRCKPT